MFVELHIIQNFSPANLNRDDTGAPKDCDFGGCRRARISSQCLKRAVRTAFARERLLPGELCAVRTKRLVHEAADVLAGRGRPQDEAVQVVRTALAGVGIKTDGDGMTEYLLFVAEPTIRELADLCAAQWDTLSEVAGAALKLESRVEGEGRKKSKREAKKEAKGAVPPALVSEIKTLVDGKRAADLALFGRMVADVSGMNVQAASQVAHAISTHRITMDFDYFTAVDDLAPREETGAGMLGTVEFNSACFYRYANVDVRQLRENLDDDGELVERVLLAFVQAAVLAVPSGKQNSMAAHNPPSFVLAVLREHGLWSLANAFVRPVLPTGEKGLTTVSIEALDRYWGQLASAYGADGIVAGAALRVEPEAALRSLALYRVESLAALLDRVQEAAGPVCRATAR
jgi:CRISPR system Cascade subunit CasC